MIGGKNSGDYYPLTWVGRFPVYLTTVFVALHVMGFLGSALCVALGLNWLLEQLAFSSQAVMEGKPWQVVTYAFIYDPKGGIWFAIEMFLLYSFGREVEQFLGRKAFLWLYVALLLVAPVVLTIAGLFKVESALAGAGAAHFAIFVAFVLIYPSAEMFFGLQAKWVAIVLLAIYSLEALAYHSWVRLAVLWLECGCAYLMLVAGGMRRLSVPTAWIETIRNRHVRPAQRREARHESTSEGDPFDSIDPLLEKISKYGIGSLTKRERERLEKAREALLQREKHR